MDTAKKIMSGSCRNGYRQRGLRAYTITGGIAMDTAKKDFVRKLPGRISPARAPRLYHKSGKTAMDTAEKKIMSGNCRDGYRLRGLRADTTDQSVPLF